MSGAQILWVRNATCGICVACRARGLMGSGPLRTRGPWTERVAVPAVRPSCDGYGNLTSTLTLRAAYNYADC